MRDVERNFNKKNCSTDIYLAVMTFSKKLQHKFNSISGSSSSKSLIILEMDEQLNDFFSFFFSIQFEKRIWFVWALLIVTLNGFFTAFSLIANFIDMRSIDLLSFWNWTLNIHLKQKWKMTKIRSQLMAECWMYYL